MERVTSFGAAAPGHQHRADDELRLDDQPFDGLRRRVGGLDLAAELHVEFAQPLQGAVDDRHLGPEADRHLGRVRAGDAAAQDHDPGRRNARHAAQQHAEPAVRLLQRSGPDLDGHATGDFAHRRQERQRAVRRSDRLVGDRRHAGFRERLRLLRVRREVQVGEQYLAAAELRALGQLRLLHLDDHLGLSRTPTSHPAAPRHRPIGRHRPRCRCPHPRSSRPSLRGRRRRARARPPAPGRRGIRGP